MIPHLSQIATMISVNGLLIIANSLSVVACNFPELSKIVMLKHSSGSGLPLSVHEIPESIVPVKRILSSSISFAGIF